MPCPGTQANYSLRAESEAPGVPSPRPAFSSIRVGHAPRSTGGSCELAPTAVFPTPTLQVPESRAHRPSLYQSFGATKPALFNTGFSYLGWRINSTLIKSIKYTKLDFFFRGSLQAQVNNQKVFRKTGNSVCCVAISLSLKSIPVPHHPLAKYFRRGDVCYSKS